MKNSQPGNKAVKKGGPKSLFICYFFGPELQLKFINPQTKIASYFKFEAGKIKQMSLK